MSNLAERYVHASSRVLESLGRLSRRLIGVYVLLYAVQAAGLYPVELVINLELLRLFTIVVATSTLLLYVDSGELTERWERYLQAVFLVLVVTLAVAFSSHALLSTPSEFLDSFIPALVNVALVTGVLSVVSVRRRRREESFLGRRFRGRTLTFRRQRLTRKHYTTLALVVILGLFVFIRWPFLSKPFGGAPHSDKYAIHVPVLQGMYRTANPFYHQNPGYVSMLNLDNYVFGDFWSVPVYEWPGLLLTPLRDQLGIEFITRLVTTGYGVLLLIALVLLLAELFDGEIALAGGVLFTVNPLFNVVTYLTVMDLPALLFTVVSLVLYWRDRTTYSYICCGFAVLMKLSFLLIAVSSLGILILLTREQKFYHVIKLGYFTFVPLLLGRIFVIPTAGSTIPSGIIFLSVFVFLLLGSIILFEHYDATFKTHVSKIDQQFRYTLMLFVPVLGIVALWNQIQRLAGQFLTDRYLLFNADMYVVMLNKVQQLQSDLVFFLCPVGLVWILLRGDEKLRSTSVALVGAALAYGVIASKSVFIHLYYKHIFVIACIVGFLGVLDSLRQFDFPTEVTTAVVLTVVLLVASSGQVATAEMLGNRIDGTEQMGEYIDSNLSDSEPLLRSYPAGSLVSIYSDAKVVIPQLPRSESPRVADLKSDIQSKGFGCALRARNITHYISLGPGEFERFNHLLVATGEFTSTTRREMILRQTNSAYRETTTNVSTPDEFFQVEKKIGDWYLYRVRSQSSGGGCEVGG